MNPISILVVEDDPGIALEIEIIISELGYQFLGNPRSSVEAIKAIDLKKPDLIIMDIDLEDEMDGITVAETINSINIPIIFITGIEDPSVFERAKNTFYNAYLIKPFHSLTLRSAIENAIKNTQNSSNQTNEEKGILVKNGNRFQRLLLEEILWIKVDGNYCYFFTVDKKYILKLSMKRVLALINMENKFVQVHRNHVIQKKMINNYNSKKEVTKINNVDIPVGRIYKDEVMKILKQVLN